jgi:hypothetical protein
MKKTAFSRGKQVSSMPFVAAETLLREMGFVNVLSLDSLDAIVAIASNASDYNSKKAAKGPRMTTSLTVGLLSIHTCRDVSKTSFFVSWL